MTSTASAVGVQTARAAGSGDGQIFCDQVLISASSPSADSGAIDTETKLLRPLQANGSSTTTYKLGECAITPTAPAMRLYRWSMLNRWKCFPVAAIGIFILFNLYMLRSSPFTNSAMRGGRADSRRATPGAGEFNYGIMVDAGSTGSRLFLYEWQLTPGDSAAPPFRHPLLNIRAVDDPLTGQPVVKKLSPGLSTFGENPQEAADYMSPLLDYASRFIPVEKQSQTPVYIFATAGMRLLTPSAQEKILENLREKLPIATKLKITAENIQVITGKWEGVYGWISINYILGRLPIAAPSQKNGGGAPADTQTPNARRSGGSSPSASTENAQQRPKTVGVIDMGGASAQLALELPSPNSSSPYFPPTASNESGHGNENVELVSLRPAKGQIDSLEANDLLTYQLYVTTFLGYGVNEAAKKYEKLLLAERARISSPHVSDENHSNDGRPSVVEYLDDECLPRDMLKLITDPEDNTQLVRRGTGDWDDCVRNISALLRQSPSPHYCLPPHNCLFGFVPAPSLSLSDIELYGFSEYWYSVEDVLGLGGLYNHNEFERRAREFCQTRWAQTGRKAKHNLYPKADGERLETQCFKSAWIHSVLHDGLKVDEVEHHFRSAFKIRGEEVQWTLGAMIYQIMRHGGGGAEQTGSTATQPSLGSFSIFLLCAVIVLFLLAIAAVMRRRLHSKSGLEYKKSWPANEDHLPWSQKMGRGVLRLPHGFRAAKSQSSTELLI